MPHIVATNTNAYSLWSAGMIAATNTPLSANWLQTSALSTDPNAVAFRNGPYSVCQNTLQNTALKGGFNAIRVFLDLGEYQNSSGATEHDVSTIAANGAAIWSDSTTARNSTRGWIIPRYNLLAAQIDNLLTLCGQLGMGVILVADGYYSGANGALWSSQSLQDTLATFWGVVAARWAGKPALIGYELLNEPAPGVNPDGTTMPYSTMRAAGNLNNYKALMEACAKKIRQYDSITPIIADTFGGSINAIDFFTDVNGGTGNLIKDVKVTTSGTTTIDRIVYSAHNYTPARYCNQGIYNEGYHATGLCYPNFVANDIDYRNGQTYPTKYDFRSGSGMSAVFASIQSFKATYKKPVFIGEFGASSSLYLKRCINSSEMPGASRYVPPTSPARAIVGLNYDPVTREGILIMQTNISLFDVTDNDPIGGGSTRPQCRNKVNLMIEPLKDANGSPITTITGYDALGLLTGVNLEGYWYPDSTSTTMDANYRIRFPWPAGVTPPARNYGVTNANAQGSQKSSSDLRLELQQTNPPTLASIKIVLQDSQVAQQEASRVMYARDVLRQCAALGLSWGWFADYNSIETYLWDDKFFQVDNLADPATSTGGKLRAMLKRAASQSYE